MFPNSNVPLWPVGDLAENKKPVLYFYVGCVTFKRVLRKLIEVMVLSDIIKGANASQRLVKTPPTGVYFVIWDNKALHNKASFLITLPL